MFGVVTLPPAMAATAGSVAGIGSSVAATNAGVAAPQLGTVPMAPEPASILFDALMKSHGMLYQMTQMLGTLNNVGIYTTLGVSGASYEASELGSALTLG